MYNTDFFARKELNKKTGETYFLGIGSNLLFAKCFGESPYYRIKLKETDLSTGKYFGWKDYLKKEYNMIFPSLVQAEICFPYGSKAEEERGLGKLVGFLVEDSVQID